MRRFSCPLYSVPSGSAWWRVVSLTVPTPAQKIDVASAILALHDEGCPMLSFLSDLAAHSEWANAVFFHAWGKSPAREHEEMRQRVAHILGVQQGFVSILRGQAARWTARRAAAVIRGPEGSGRNGSRRLARVRRHVDSRWIGADRADSMVSRPTVRHHCGGSAGASCDAHAASSRTMHD